MMYDVGDFVATITGVIGHPKATAGLAGMFEEMNYSEDQRQMMIDEIPTLALSCCPDGTTGFLNKPWLQHTVFLMEKSLGWGWKVSVHPEDLGKLMDTWLGLLASGESGEKEARLPRFDREYRWFLFRAVPLRDEQDKLLRRYGTNTDIEDLKRAESLLSAEKRRSEMIASGASLKAIPGNLCNCFDAQSPNFTSSIQLMDFDGEHLRPTAGSRAPRNWAKAILLVRIGPCVDSCGTAAFLKRRVIVSDIAIDSLWSSFVKLPCAAAFVPLGLSQSFRKTTKFSVPSVSTIQNRERRVPVTFC